MARPLKGAEAQIHEAKDGREAASPTLVAVLSPELSVGHLYNLYHLRDQHSALGAEGILL